MDFFDLIGNYTILPAIFDFYSAPETKAGSIFHFKEIEFSNFSLPVCNRYWLHSEEFINILLRMTTDSTTDLVEALHSGEFDEGFLISENPYKGTFDTQGSPFCFSILERRGDCILVKLDRYYKGSKRQLINASEINMKQNLSRVFA